MADLGADVTRMLDHAEAVVRHIAAKFGFTDVGGWRASDPYPDHPGGYAADFMTKSRAQGDQAAAYMVNDAAQLGTDYVIWWGKVWDADRDPPGLPWERWRPYSGSNPHTDHVHWTGRKTPTPGMTLLGLKDNAATAVGKLFDVDAFMGRVEGTSVTLLAAGVGVVLLGVGVVLAVQPALRKAVKANSGV